MAGENIFLSYSRADGSAFARRLTNDLQQQSFEVWLDRDDIRAGVVWDQEIQKAIETCDCFLFIETFKSVSSGNVLDEVHYALELGKKIIPLIVVDSKTPFRLQRLQHIDFSGDYQVGFSQLLAELQNTPQVQPITAGHIPPSQKTGSNFKRYAGIAAGAVAALLLLSFFLFNKNKQKQRVADDLTTAIVNDSSIVSEQPSVKFTEPAVANDAKESKIKIVAKKQAANTKPLSKPDGDLSSFFQADKLAGDWTLERVEPKATSWRGYLKIEKAENDQSTIKSYVQFYYPQNNDTSYLSVFNAFAGCSLCNLQKNTKLSVEDISISSRTIERARDDQPDSDIKKGDIVKDASATKSISGQAQLRFINNNSAAIIIQKTEPVTLAYGLAMPAFKYTFYFKKRS